MPVSTITLVSYDDAGAVADSVVVSAPNDTYLLDDIILDVNPQGMYDTGFKLRTQSGAFETGGRIVGLEVPIREPILPFWLTKASRPRFQKLWGTPYNLRTVRAIWDGPSGPRSLNLKLAKEISYTTEDGFDVKDDDDTFHAVVSTVAVNPMYEGVEDVAVFTNPDDRFTLRIQADGGKFPLSFGGSTTGPTSTISYNVTPAVLQSTLEGLASVGAGHVTVTGTPATSTTAGNYLIVFSGVNGVLTGTDGTLTAGGFWGSIGLVHGKTTIDYAPNVGYFDVWNPTEQPLWLEWVFDPAEQWQFPDFGFGQERKFSSPSLPRPIGTDAARMIVTPQLTQMLSVMSDPMMDTYVNQDLSNAAGLFNGVEPVYPVPPYTQGVEMPVVCCGPAGSRAALRQRRFWSAESGLEM